MKRVAAILSLVLLSLSVLAQSTDIEYGKPSELKGLTKVFVDTGADMKNRDRIIKELEKANLGLVILDSVDNAEIILIFKPGIETGLSATTRPVYGTNTSRTTVDQHKMQTGAGFVALPRGERLRVVLSFDDVEKTIFEKKPATNFGKTFVKAYKKANDLK